MCKGGNRLPFTYFTSLALPSPSQASQPQPSALPLAHSPTSLHLASTPPPHPRVNSDLLIVNPWGIFLSSPYLILQHLAQLATLSSLVSRLPSSSSFLSAASSVCFSGFLLSPLQCSPGHHWGSTLHLNL